MTLEESKEVIPMMEAMITQIEEQQNIMAEMLQEIQEKDEKLMCFQEQEERLQQLEKELSELLQILPDTEELLMLLEEKTDQIQKLTDENQQWQELAQKLTTPHCQGVRTCRPQRLSARVPTDFQTRRQEWERCRIGSRNP